MTNTENALRGARNRRKGETLENMITGTAEYYRNLRCAHIEKTPEPTKVLRRMENGQFVMCFASQAQPDYKGTLLGGRGIAFEAKHTDGDRISQSRVTEAQSAGLDWHEKMGALCFVLISIRYEHFYRVPWVVFREMKARYGHKYMGEGDLKEFEVPQMSGYILFLKKGDGKYDE